MNKSTSILLDIMRFSAALAVFAAHFSWPQFSGGRSFPGHAAVIVFFVLSGFVIAFAAEVKDRTFPRYAAARLSRLYSVILPALALTLVLDKIGFAVNPTIYEPSYQTDTLLRLATAATFTSQLWAFDINTLSNNAYWSLPFEFWYYVLFAAGCYTRGKLRLVLVGAAALIAGPKILLYLPVWLLGVGIYRFGRLPIGRDKARLLGAAALLALPLLYIMDVHTRHDGAWLPVGFSPVDYPIALAIGLIIAVFPSAGIDLTRLGGVARFLAGRTFSLYLYHLPLLHFVAAILPQAWPMALRATITATATLATVAILASYTEQRKGPYVRFVHWAFDLVERRRKPPVAVAGEGA